MKYLFMVFFFLLCGVAQADQTVMIQVRYSEDVVVNGMKTTYSDALYYAPEQYQKLAQEDIDKVKADRIAVWKDAVEHPVAPVEVTKEEIQAQLNSIEDQKVSLESQKVELTAKLSTAKSK